MLNIIAGHIAAMLGKFNAIAFERTAVHARQKTFDDEASLEVQAADFGQYFGIDDGLGVREFRTSGIPDIRRSAAGGSGPGWGS